MAGRREGGFPQSALEIAADCATAKHGQEGGLNKRDGYGQRARNDLVYGFFKNSGSFAIFIAATSLRTHVMAA